MVAAFFALSLLPSCDRAFFDFGDPLVIDASTPVDDCDSVAPATYDCAALLDSGGCYGHSVVTTVSLEDGLGCTPGGLAFGAVELPATGEETPMYLYAWSAYDQTGVELDEESGAGSDTGDEPALLSVFADACGKDPIGIDPVCDYREWLFVSEVEKAGSLFLHAQTSTAAAVTVGYQLMAGDDWGEPLPEAGEDLSCALLFGGALSARLIEEAPWSGAPVGVNLYAAPPATESTASLCGQQGIGWRQAAFLMRNQTDDPVELTGLGLSAGDLPAGSVDYHFGIYGCSSEGVVAGGSAALVESCYDSGDHSTKTFSFTAPVWDDEDPTTEMVLVLQIPPSAGYQLDLTFELAGADTKASGR